MTKAKTRKRRVAARAKDPAFHIAARSKRTGKHATPGEGTRQKAAVAVGYAARVRHGVIDHENPMSGYPVGQLVIAKRISREDHDLLYAYALSDEAWRRVTGMPALNPPAITMEGARGRVLQAEGDPDAEAATIRAYTRRRDVLVRVLGSDGFIQFENHVLSDCPVVTPLAVYVVQMGVAALRRVA